MSRQWWPTNPKDVFIWLLRFVLVLNALVRKSSDLLEFNQTHNATNDIIQVWNICFTDISRLVLLDILFVLDVKLAGTFSPNQRCDF